MTNYSKFEGKIIRISGKDTYEVLKKIVGYCDDIEYLKEKYACN